MREVSVTEFYKTNTSFVYTYCAVLYSLIVNITDYHSQITVLIFSSVNIQVLLIFLALDYISYRKVYVYFTILNSFIVFSNNPFFTQKSILRCTTLLH